MSFIYVVWARGRGIAGVSCVVIAGFSREGKAYDFADRETARRGKEWDVIVTRVLLD